MSQTVVLIGRAKTLYESRAFRGLDAAVVVFELLRLLELGKRGGEIRVGRLGMYALPCEEGTVEVVVSRRSETLLWVVLIRLQAD